MFEVGKIYCSKITGKPFEVLSVDEGQAFAKDVSNHYPKCDRLVLYNFNNYIEVKTPVVEKVVRYLYQSRNPSHIYFVETLDHRTTLKNIGKFELTITDGVLTDTKVIK